jgi:hypothetical protein
MMEVVMKKIALLTLFFSVESYATCQLVNDTFICNNSITYLQLAAPPQVIYINPGIQPPPTVIIQPQILPGRSLPPPPDFGSKIVPRENIQLWDGK